jgi:hypothetical protein
MGTADGQRNGYSRRSVEWVQQTVSGMGTTDSQWNGYNMQSVGWVQQAVSVVRGEKLDSTVRGPSVPSSDSSSTQDNVNRDYCQPEG